MGSADARTLAPDHPDALALVAAMADAWPAARYGWRTGRDAFVALYEGDRAAAGAGIDQRPHGMASIPCLCIPETSRGRGLGAALVAALEAEARRRGCERLRVQEPAFMLGDEVPWERAGYTVGPPYDGDTDVDTWAEKVL